MQPYSRFQNIVLSLLRFFIAIIFIQAAYAKFGLWIEVPDGMSLGLVYLLRFTSLAELLGGSALLLGFLTRLAASGLVLVMLGAIAYLQFVVGTGFAGQGGPGWNFPLALLGGCLALIAFGAGPFSFDAIYSRRKQKNVE